MSLTKLLALGSVRRLSWGSNDDAAVRTTHAYTLGARLNEVTGIVDDWKWTRLGLKSCVHDRRLPTMNDVSVGVGRYASAPICRAPGGGR